MCAIARPSILVLLTLAAALLSPQAKPVEATGAKSSGTTDRVSVASDATQANAASYGPRMSADGGYVAYSSRATNLVAGDTNGVDDIFVRDRQTGATTRVSVDSSGNQANGHSFWADVSANGRYVAFQSYASNLVSGDTNGVDDIFVRDRQTGATTRVSVDSSGNEANGSISYWPAISAGGRFVAFASFATNLVPGDNNGTLDIFVRDRVVGTTERVSIDSTGSEGNGESLFPAISDDGRFVAFQSFSTNLVSGDTNGVYDIFVHDRLTGNTERVSVNSADIQANSSSQHLTISADGRYVAFTSNASNLVPGDTNSANDIFVHDRVTGMTERVSLDSEGIQGNATSMSPLAISADGRHVAFRSEASNLVPGDNNGTLDIFVRDRLTGTTERVSVERAGNEANGYSGAYTLGMSADGRYVAFMSNASNLVPSDTNGVTDIFVRDRGTTPAPLAPDLSINKQVWLGTDTDGDGIPDVVNLDTIQYVMDVRNEGDAEAANVIVRDDLPNHVTIVEGSLVSLQGSCSMTGATSFECDLGTIAPGETVGVAFDAVTDCVEADVVVENTATVDPDNTVAESNESNNTDSVMTTIQASREACLKALGEKFSPILYIFDGDPCVEDNAGDPYDPIEVEIMLDDPFSDPARPNATTALWYDTFDIPGRLDTLLKGVSPNALELAAWMELADDEEALEPERFYIDIKGLNPRQGDDEGEISACAAYAEKYNGLAGQYDVVTYLQAMVEDVDGQTEVNLTFWLFYYFNDWTNRHEGDWERVVLSFPAQSIAAAWNGDIPPEEVAYSKHLRLVPEPWVGSDLLRKFGNHPNVYIARGSHANYFRPGRHRPAGGIRGIDVAPDESQGRLLSTFLPLGRRLRVVPLPDCEDANLSNGRFAWLLFRGRWGQEVDRDAFDDTSGPLGGFCPP